MTIRRLIYFSDRAAGLLGTISSSTVNAAIEKAYGAPAPAQDEREAPEVVAVLYKSGGALTAEECGIALEVCAKVETPLMTVAQHERIVAALNRPAQTEQQPLMWVSRVLKGSLVGKLIQVDPNSPPNSALYGKPFAVYAAPIAQAAPQGLRIVFDGPPGPEAGRFVEIENSAGYSVNAGEWRERTDGLWELVLHAASPQPEQSGLLEALTKCVASLDQLLPYLAKVPADIGLLNDALISARAALAAQGGEA